MLSFGFSLVNCEGYKTDKYFITPSRLDYNKTSLPTRGGYLFNCYSRKK